MFTQLIDKPLNREAIVEFIQSLPKDMICTQRNVEFEYTSLDTNDITTGLDLPNGVIYRVDITFERYTE